ncbi:MAG: haloalkane dehalogenase [Pseudomonadota bacterium]
MESAVKLGVALASAMMLSGCLTVMPAMAPKAKNVQAEISAEFPYESQFISVDGQNMHYVEQGSGDVIVLLHGNPTSSYLWRNVIPELSETNRVIAVDMIGMGKSDKPDIPYRLSDHIDYFTGFMDAMDLQDVTLVLHDWGGGVGLDYAAHHADNVRGIALMEAVMRPVYWEDAGFAEKFLFTKFRDEEEGFELNAERNYFVEKVLPMMSGRKLTDAEQAAYEAPFPTVESRRPVAQWPMEIPIDDQPADNAERIGANYNWLKTADTPVLLITADPGVIITKDARAEIAADIPRLEMVNIGSGMHYIQEVQPVLIGETIENWESKLP